MFLLGPFPLYKESLCWELRLSTKVLKNQIMANILAEEHWFFVLFCLAWFGWQWIKQIEIEVLPKSPSSISAESCQVWLQGRLLNMSLSCQFINSWFEEDIGTYVYLFFWSFLTKRELWPRRLPRRHLFPGTSSRKERDTVTCVCFTCTIWYIRRYCCTFITEAIIQYSNYEILSWKAVFILYCKHLPHFQKGCLNSMVGIKSEW